MSQQKLLTSFFQTAPRAPAADGPAASAAAAASIAPTAKPASPAAAPPPARAESAAAAPPPPAGAKRPAAPAAASAAAAKKRKGADSAAGGGSSSSSPPLAAAAWGKVALEDIHGADYQDESLDWCALPDGRELLLCAEVWHVPERGARPTQLGVLPGDCFAVVRDWPLYAVVDDGRPPRPARSLGPRTFAAPAPPRAPPAIAFRSLPDNVEVGRVALPAGVLPRRLVSCARAGGVAFTHGGALYFISVTPRAAAAAAAAASASSSSASGSSSDPGAPAAAYSLHLHGGAPLGAGATGNALALWVEPSSSQLFAVVSSVREQTDGQIRLLRVTLPAVPAPGGEMVGDAAPAAAAASATAPPPPPPAAASVECLRAITMHGPMRKADKEGYVSRVVLWTHPTSRALLALTLGSDAELAVATLHDGTALLPSEGSDQHGPERAWHATSNGSGGSKAYAYARPQFLAACPGLGVALTGSQSESVMHVWDVLTPKSSPAGKLLSKTPKLADTCRPGRALLMNVAFAPSGRVLAYSNSNDADDATLKLVWPVGK